MYVYTPVLADILGIMMILINVNAIQNASCQNAMKIYE